MNRVYRIVWSESRNAFIVVNENAKAKGKPSSTRKAVAAAVVMALAAMAAVPALAANVCSVPGLTTIDTAQAPGDNCLLGTGDSLTVTASGSLSGANPAVGVFGGDAATSISNSGTISSNTIGIRLSDSSITGGITNSGTISGLWGGIVVGGTVPGSSVTGGISNSGMISGGFIGITLATSSVDSISNDLGGTITGVNTGIRLRSSSTVTGGISNSGTISGGIGIYASNSTIGSIGNSGTINSSFTGIYASLSTLGSITNSDTISGTNVGIDINNGSVVTDSITNTGGTISGNTNGIAARTNSTIGSISNSGTITGNSYGISASNNSTISSITNSTGGAISGIIARTNSTLGNISNSGTITGNSYGISASNSTLGSITNNGGGTISGISAGSSILGSITNNEGGAISVNGILVSNSTMNGSISNSGMISGNSTGIRISGNSTVTGDIINSGTISGSSSSGAGISIFSSSVGSITNSGSISGNTGILLNSGSSVGSITNSASGIISAGTSSGAGIRISSSSTVTGGIINSGTISASNGYAIDIQSSFITGNIENNGATALISGSTGIYVANGNIGGSIINSGTISGTGNSGSGIYINNSTVTGDISNDVGGTISGGFSSSGAGIRISNSSTVGSIINSGTISGNTGISISSGSTVTGGITNSGTISGGAYAIYVDGTSTLANIDIAGTTAHLIGAVFAQNTALNITSGASFTSEGRFDVGSFNIANTGRFNMAHDVTTSTGFANAGTLAVAAGTTATITGDYTQAASGVFETGLIDNTTYGKLVVTGTADLLVSNKLAVNVVGAPVLASGTVLPGVITAGTLTAGPSYTVTDNSALFDFTGVTNVNAIDLMIVAAAATGGPSVVSSVNATGNTSAAGAAAVFDALIAAAPGGDMGTVITALGALPTQQAVSDAVVQTLPLLTGGMAQATSANLHGVNRVVQARQEENRGISSGDSFVGNRMMWLKPLGSWADQKNSNGAFGYRAQTYGMALGADGELSQALRLGAAFAYTHSAVDSNSGAQTAGVDSYQAVLYGSRSLAERTELNWQADYGYNHNKGDRYIAFVNRTALADYTSSSIHLGAGVGRSLTMNPQTTFTPSFRADYTSISDNSYTETGAGALNLVVDGKTTDEFILAVDGKVAYAVSDTSTLIANLGVGYDTQAKQSSITAAFQGGGAAFTTKGISPSSTLVRGGLGMVVNSSSAMEITARYDIEARSDFTAQTASVKLRMPF